MANFFAIHSVAASLMTYLRNAYPSPLREAHPCSFQVLSSEELASWEAGTGAVLTLFIYRVTPEEHSRNRVSGPTAFLGLELHMLLTIWTSDALTEHAICAWVMSELHRRPTLDSSSLTSDAGWRADESVQIIPDTFSTDELFRVWDALAPKYRLSLPYRARVVQLDLGPMEGRPVVATRFEYGGANG